MGCSLASCLEKAPWRPSSSSARYKRMLYLNVKTLYLTFDDLEKAFDRVPRKVVKWALRKGCVDKWIIELIMVMYSH